ncbi:MAG: efflux RND transporter periplasmic adaptor subunit [Niabella sp.]|nr:efflux RND transporter periplasmic adaptor subunit [Niabella sp.]
MQKNNLVIALFNLLIAAAFLQGCGAKKSEADERPKYVIPDSVMRTMVIDTIQRGQKINSITLTGSVDFNQDKQVNIFPLVSGNVQDIKVQLGDFVKAGQVLAVVKSSEMAGYSNNLVNAESGLAVAKNALAAQKSLYKSGLSSQMDLTSAQAQYDQAAAQVEMAKRVLNINGNTTNGSYVVRAPISGFIVQKNVTNNTAIRTDNGSALFVVSDLNNVWIEANVYESNIAQVHLGDDVSVTTISYPNRVFKGKVDKIQNVLDPTNKVMKVRVVLPNTDYALKPQMFASVNIVSKQADSTALQVPSGAIIFDHSQHYVLVFHSPSDVRITRVEVAGTNDDKTYIASGVNQGDRVIAKDALLIYDALNN